MRDDYKIVGPTQPLSVEIEKDLADKLQSMSKFTQLSLSELMNTAVKRFVSGHKDFLPPGADRPDKLRAG